MWFKVSYWTMFFGEKLIITLIPVIAGSFTGRKECIALLFPSLFLHFRLHPLPRIFTPLFPTNT